MKRKRTIVVSLFTLLLCSCSAHHHGSSDPVQEKSASLPAEPSQAAAPPAGQTQAQPNRELSVPVLMYHSISYEKGNKLCLKPSEFEHQLQTLFHRGYSTMTANELLTAWETGTALPPKPLVITLDDGYSDNYTNAFPILQKYKAKATIFIITGKVGKPSFMSWSQIEEMERSGLVDFQSHSVHHLDMRSLTPEQIKDELNSSKRTLESKLNKSIRVFCYPSGKLSPAVLQSLNESGYQMAFTTRPGYAHHSQGPLLLHRLRVMSGDPFPLLDH